MEPLPKKVVITSDLNVAHQTAEKEPDLEDCGNVVTTDIERQDAQSATESDAPYSVWSHNEKKLILFTASVAAFFSPVSGHIYFPAINRIAEDLKVSNSLINLSITTYMVSTIVAHLFPRMPRKKKENAHTLVLKGFPRADSCVCGRVL